MPTYHYTPKNWKTFAQGQSLEWVLTNGLGGYAGSTLINAHHRTHQGYLIGALHSPTERYLALSKISEALIITKVESDNAKSANSSAEQAFYNLDASAHKGEICADGCNFLTGFTYDGTVTWKYELPQAQVVITKRLCLAREENRCALLYEIENKSQFDAKLKLTPYFNFREHNANSRAEDLNFELSSTDNTLSLIPAIRTDVTINFFISEGSFSRRTKEQSFDADNALSFEQEQEVEGLDTHFVPYDIEVKIPANSTKELALTCEILTEGQPSALEGNEPSTEVVKALVYNTFGVVEAYFNRIQTNSPSPFCRQLIQAADAFIVQRQSTGTKTILAGLPWFTDWGRDTMIAFTGLTLCTGRFDEAAEILLTFAKYIKNGIVPNMFPDDGAEPLYNTVDASLWYFYAVDQYLKYVNTPKAYAFIEKEIYPALKEILAAYEGGTDNSIYMDSDCLIHAGSGLDQVTWMDVRVGEWVVTPRHGKPVEINALWYNALRVMQDLATRYNELSLAEHCRATAEQAQHSFNEKFWWQERNCLYDVVDESSFEEADDHLRPNQIYAVSLPYAILSPERQQAVVETVKEELFVGCGLRTLSVDHPDYQGAYVGALSKRDAAYHQGTAWGFLLGGFIDAYLKVNDYSPLAKERAKDMLAPIKEHLVNTGCIGQINEIFDGDGLHTPRGCYAQAWSVGEVLRIFNEYRL